MRAVFQSVETDQLAGAAKFTLKLSRSATFLFNHTGNSYQGREIVPTSRENTL